MCCLSRQQAAQELQARQLPEVDFLDRMTQSYKKGDKIEVVKMQDFEQLLADKKIDENTIVFNNMVTTKSDFDHLWEVPLKKSWHQQFLS